jgi:hypothetical protein
VEWASTSVGPSPPTSTGRGSVKPSWTSAWSGLLSLARGRRCRRARRADERQERASVLSVGTPPSTHHRRRARAGTTQGGFRAAAADEPAERASVPSTRNTPVSLVFLRPRPPRPCCWPARRGPIGLRAKVGRRRHRQLPIQGRAEANAEEAVLMQML